MGHIRVLIVDDSHNVQVALGELLGTIDAFEVVATATSEQQATEWLLTHRHGWDLAILDLLLEDGSGFGMLRRCRMEHPNGRVVVFSGYASPAIRDKCLQLGADAVYLKTELEPFLAFLEGIAADQKPGPPSGGRAKPASGPA